MKTIKGSIFVWFGFLVLAFANGAFRELVLISSFDFRPLYANQISCLTGVILWTLLIWFAWAKLQVSRWSQALWISLGWLVATFLFETFVIGKNLTWPEILHTYNLQAGQYWGLALLWIGILPLIAFSLSQRTRAFVLRPNAVK